MTNSTSRHSVTNLANAFRYSEVNDLPLTVFLVISWAKTLGWKDDLLAERQERLFYKLARWLRRKEVPAAYLYTIENSRRMGLHTNLAVHVPARLFSEFIAAFQSFIPGFVENTHTLHFLADGGEVPPKFFKNNRCRAGVIRYFLKGLNHADTFIGPDGKLQNFGDAIGIAHRGQQGTVLGKRAGVSHALGSRQRLRAGYVEQTNPESLHKILNPVANSTR